MQESLTYDVPLVSTRYAGRFLKFLKSKGINKEVIEAHNPLVHDLLDNPDVYFTMNQVIPAFEAAEWLLNDEKAAFEFGQQIDLGVHGLFGYTLLSLEDQPKLIESVVKHIQVCIPLFDMEVSQRGSNMVIRLRDAWEAGTGRSFMAKIYMGSIYTIASKICSDIRFDCDFKSKISKDEWLLLAQNSQWNFEAEYNQITLPLSINTIEKERQDVVYSIAQNRLLSQSSSASIVGDVVNDFTAKVREHIMKAPGHSSIERSAELLSMSSRYLRQQLAEEGASYRGISNEVKKNYANLYLRDTPMPINDIADKLGFGDQASFTRAYRSWTGSTPGDVRKKSKLTTKP